MYELELFAGAGGGILGKNLLGHITVGAVEIEPFCRKVLLQRQQDDCCPIFPIWDDVRTFSVDNPECSAYIEWLRSIRDNLVISGGFPCQDISSSGRGGGITGAKSSMWFEMARIIAEIQPAKVFVENSPFIVTRGLEHVLSSLAEMGYNAKWCVLGAGHLNYPIVRERFWLLGQHHKTDGQGLCKEEKQRFAAESYLWSKKEFTRLPDASRARLVADGYAGRDVDGVADAVDRVAALGNGQVPAVAAVAWALLNDQLK